MGSNYLTSLADWCRDAGLHVHEVDGWQQRARSSGGYENGRPWAIMWHHTASSTSPQNDVNYMCYNCPDAPVANFLLDRDGHVWVMAAGATNTNGKGGPTGFSKGVVPLDSMNSYAVGIEAANNGMGEPWPQVQIDAYFTLNNLLAKHLDLNPDDCCTHHQWAPTRKVDPATAAAVQGPWQPGSVTSSGTWSQPDLEREVMRRVGHEPPPVDPPPPDQEDEMTYIYAFKNYANTFSDKGVALTPEAYTAMVNNGAVVVVSADHEQHIESLLHLSGLDRTALVPK